MSKSTKTNFNLKNSFKNALKVYCFKTLIAIVTIGVMKIGFVTYTGLSNTFDYNAHFNKVLLELSSLQANLWIIGYAVIYSLVKIIKDFNCSKYVKKDRYFNDFADRVIEVLTIISGVLFSYILFSNEKLNDSIKDLWGLIVLYFMLVIIINAFQTLFVTDLGEAK